MTSRIRLCVCRDECFAELLNMEYGEERSSRLGLDCGGRRADAIGETNGGIREGKGKREIPPAVLIYDTPC